MHIYGTNDIRTILHIYCMSDILFIVSIYHFVLPQEQEKCGGGGLEGAAAAEWQGCARLLAGPGGEPTRAAPRGRQNWANPHELASNVESTRPCCRNSPQPG